MNFADTTLRREAGGKACTEYDCVSVKLWESGSSAVRSLGARGPRGAGVLLGWGLCFGGCVHSENSSGWLPLTCAEDMSYFTKMSAKMFL